MDSYGAPQQIADRLPEALTTPLMKIVPHRSLGRKVLRQMTPATPGSEQVQHHVEHFPQVRGPSPATSRRRQQRCNQLPLRFRQITRVGLSALFLGIPANPPLRVDGSTSSQRRTRQAARTSLSRTLNFPHALLARDIFRCRQRPAPALHRRSDRHSFQCRNRSNARSRDDSSNHLWDIDRRHVGQRWQSQCDCCARSVHGCKVRSLRLVSDSGSIARVFVVPP